MDHIEEESEEDKICPWDYGTKDDSEACENESDEDSTSDWSEVRRSFEIASGLQRPGGNLLRSIL